MGLPSDATSRCTVTSGVLNKLKELNLIESKMIERILKSSISTLDAFNEVRNEHSLGHDNPVLNRSKSLLIFNHVTSPIRFVWTLEQSMHSEEDCGKLASGSFLDAEGSAFVRSRITCFRK